MPRNNNSKLTNGNHNPKPVMKWAGGKRQLLKEFDKFIPKEFNQYIEPFFGGGALFFHLQPDSAVIIDNNPDLINIYQVIKDQVNELIPILKKHSEHKSEKDYFYNIRNLDRDLKNFNKMSNIEKAARHLYMNKVCFNGLYRVNSKGQFNVPFGKYVNPLICDEENLIAVNKALQNVQILNGSFEKCLDYAKSKDFVYLDPPYVPLSETANFTSYTKDKFGFEDQRELFRIFEVLHKRGCKVMLSNSYCEFVLKLYEKYRIETIMATRAINSDATKRGKIKEVLILNYPNLK